MLRAWCASDCARAVAVLVGAGGVGKTRLALKLAAEWEASGGEWVLVADGEEGNAVAAARGVTSGRLLLVVDYAETRSRLDVFLRAVLDDPGPIRILLAARSLGEWWERLVEKSAPAVARLLAEGERIQLDGPIVSGASDAELAAAAVPDFASKLGVAAPQHPEFDIPAGRVPVLVLHAAALVAVLRFASESATPLRVVVTDEVVKELLAHEARYWWRTASAAGLSDGGAVFKPVVAATTLLGAASLAEAAQLVTRIPALSRTTSSEQWRWARWLYDLYPAGDSGRLGSLQPDLLAEMYVVSELVKNPDVARACLRDLTADQAHRALTLLARASVHQDRAEAIVATALRSNLAELAVPAAQVAVQTRSELGGLLAAALWEVPLPLKVLARIAPALPYPSVALAEASAAVVLKGRESLPPDADLATIASWSNASGHVLDQLGRFAEALKAAEETVAAYRKLAAADPLRYRPDLASSLITLGSVFSELGRSTDAIPVTREAVTIYVDLTAAEPDRYRSELAKALSNVGLYFAQLGRPGDALPFAEQAVAVTREQTGTNPVVHSERLAAALVSLGTRLGELGHSVRALAVSQEGVTVYRELAGADPDRYRPDLADALINLGVQFSQADRTEDASVATQEAVSAYRELASDNPGRYRGDLATSLSNQGLWLNALNHPEEALSHAREAVAIRRDLAATHPGRYRPDLAKSLTDLGVCLRSLDWPAESSSAAQEAVSIYRELVTGNPDRYGLELARSLMLQSMTLNDHVEALPIIQEAVALYRDTASTYADGYQRDLAAALLVLGMRSWELEHYGDAIAAAKDAVAVHRELASVTLDRYQPVLAACLGILGRWLSESGHPEEALGHLRVALLFALPVRPNTTLYLKADSRPLRQLLRATEPDRTKSSNTHPNRPSQRRARRTRPDTPVILGRGVSR